MRRKHINYHDRRTIHVLTSLFLLFCGSSVSLAQVYNTSFDRISVADGLSHSTVYNTTQDHKGFMWFATGNGLCRFDGYNFKTYYNDAKDKNSLSSNELLQLAQDPNGYIWVMSRGGKANLNRLNPLTGDILRIGPTDGDSSSISSDVVSDINIDKAGNIWINAGGTLNLIKASDASADTVRFSHFNHPSLRNATWRSFMDSKQNLLIFSDSLFLFDQELKQFKNMGLVLGTAGNLLINVNENKHGDLWVATGVGGLLKFLYNKTNNSYSIDKHTPYNVDPANRNTVQLDNWGRVWIGTENKGLWIYNEQDSSMVQFANNKAELSSISDNTIYSLHIDRSGVLWIGTFSQGLCKYDLYRKQFQHFKLIPDNPNSLSGNVISSIHSTNTNELWVGCDLGGGVNRIIWNGDKEPKFTHYKNNPNDPNSLGGDNVLSLFQQRNGDVWVGSAFWKISRITPEKPGTQEKPIIRDFSNIGGWRFTFFEDRNDTVWAGSFGEGLARINPATGNFTTFRNDPNKPESLIEDIVWASAEDNAGNIWIGGRGKGISIIKAEEKYKANPKFINIIPNVDDESSLGNGIICVFCQDKAGNMWIGTAGGLDLATCKDNDFSAIESAEDISFTLFRRKDGLPSDWIQGITEDNNGNLWISTTNGLSKYDLSEKTFTNYDAKDGLQGNEFWHNAYFKDLNGRMYFGGSNGFNAFYPDSIKPNPFLPSVEIIDFKLFNKSVAPDSIFNEQVVLTKPIEETKSIELTYQNNMFSIEFAALHFTQPGKNKYAYQMEGFDKDWILTTANRRYATYTNLPTGDYTFMVKAANCDNIWNSKNIKTIKLSILPPWWETLWFRSLVLIAVISLAASFYFYRVNDLKRRQEILEKTVKERTEELSEANVIMEERQEEIIQQAEELKIQKQEIEEVYKDSQLISDFGQKLTSTLDLHSINGMTFDYVKSIMHVDAFGIGIYNEDKKAILYPGFIEQGEKLAPFTKSMDNQSSLSTWCITNQMTVFISDADLELNQYITTKGSKREISTKQNPQSIIHLPLTVEDKKIGLLAANSFRKNEYKEQDIVKLQTLASYIAIALDNANAYKLVETQNKHIKGSINYAQTIQQAVLPSDEIMNSYYENFVLFKPKDIVSGDFYWVKQVPSDNGLANPYTFIAVADCTGHGVPGAFMSIIGARLLDEIVEKEKQYDPDQILERLNLLIRKALKQDTTSNDDGMDVCLVRIQKQEEQFLVLFSNAKRPLLYYNCDTGTVCSIHSSINSCGGNFHIDSIPYPIHKIELKANDMLWLTSDGYTDQNNLERKKLGKMKLIETLQEIGQQPVNKQKEQLDQTLMEHQQIEKQRDDITIVGIRLS